MSALKPVHPLTEADHDGHQLSDRPVQFEVIPQVCLIADVCRILRLSQRQFFYLMARRELALVELPRFDRHRRFTGESLARVIRFSKRS